MVIDETAVGPIESGGNIPKEGGSPPLAPPPPPPLPPLSRVLRRGAGDARPLPPSAAGGRGSGGGCGMRGTVGGSAVPAAAPAAAPV